MFVAGGKVIPVDVPFTLNGLHFPANWLRLSSEEDKKAAGISWQPDPEPVDQRFYWDHGIPKQLEDQPVVDEKKKPVFDADGNPVASFIKTGSAITGGAGSDTLTVRGEVDISGVTLGDVIDVIDVHTTLIKLFFCHVREQGACCP